MACLITDGVGITCDALRRVGGVNKRAYLFNSEEKTDIVTDANGYVIDINFESYDGLYKFTSRKQAHSGGYTAQVQSPGGNKFFNHDVILKLFPEDPTEDAVLESLLVGCVGVILEDNNQQFFLYGNQNGLDQIDGTQNTGQEQASDIAYSLTLQGQEPEMPKRILITDYETTKNYLDTLVV